MANKRNQFRAEFKPDAQGGLWIKTLRLTQMQKLRLLKWSLYIAVILLALVTQDVVMSRIRLLGATTDLAVCVILMITVIEGTEVGSLFVLIASILYYYTGTPANAYSIGLLCFPGIFMCLMRQMYWHRSRASIVLASSLAAMMYEIGLYVVGIAQGLTRWETLPVFVLCGIYNFLVMIPLYTLICKIGLIGGNTWKE